jgi:predicted Zn-dependent protease
MVVAAVLVAGYGYAVRQWRGAVAAVRDGRPDDARPKLATCLRVWPDDPAVHRLAARAARLTGEFAEAEAHLNTCLRLEHGASEDTQLEFLLMRAQTGEVEEVEPLLFGYVDRGHPDARMAVETVALSYMHNLRYGPAYAALKRWAEAFPDDPRVYHYRGWVLERMNQPQGALEDYLRAIDLDPELDKVRLRVAEMYLEDKDPQKALPHLDRLHQKTPDRPEVLARLGVCRFLEGQHPEARRLLERAVAHLPADPSVLLYLARLDMEDREPGQAEGRLRRALDVDPSDTEVRYALVTALQLQGKDQDATAHLGEYDRHKALLERANHLLQEEAKKPSSQRNPGPASEIGALLLQIGQHRQGLYWMDEALARDPEHRPTHQALAEYFEKRGDTERAAVHRKHLTDSRGGP